MLAFTAKKLAVAGVAAAATGTAYYQWYQLKKATDASDPAKLDAIFDKIDKDKSGTIEASELKSALEEAGIYTNEKATALMLSRADKNMDGKLSKEEFREMMLGKK